jgi:hypothetical protein
VVAKPEDDNPIPPIALGPATEPNVIAWVRLLSQTQQLLEEHLGPTTQQDLIVLDPTAQPDPTAFGRQLGYGCPAKPNSFLTVRPNAILGLA